MGSAVAAVSLTMGIVWPEVGLYVNDTGELSVSDKGLVSGNLLAGPFTSTNNLGQYVILTIPFLLILRRRLLPFLILLIPSIVCVFWSGSRSSLLALGIGGIVALALRSRAPGRAGWWIVCLGAVTCFLLPIFASDDPDSFSGRGNLWRVSLDNWTRGDWFTGLGDKWYSELAGRRTSLGDRADFLAFHGHNQFFHLMVTAGICGLVLFVAWLCVSAKPIVNLGWPEGSIMFTWAIMWLVSGALELNFDPFDRVQFFGQSFVPLLVASVSARQATR